MIYEQDTNNYTLFNRSVHGKSGEYYVHNIENYEKGLKSKSGMNFKDSSHFLNPTLYLDLSKYKLININVQILVKLSGWNFDITYSLINSENYSKEAIADELESYFLEGDVTDIDSSDFHMLDDWEFENTTSEHTTFLIFMLIEKLVAELRNEDVAF